MRIEIKLYASLRQGRFAREERDVPDAATGIQVAAELGIPAAQVGILLVNGRHAGRQDPLHEGDVLSLFPLIGGG